MLAEKKLPFELRTEKDWERRESFLALNPAGDLPVLVEAGGSVIADSAAICEYLDEIEPSPPLFGRLPVERAEVRRLVAWFDRKFDREVTKNLVGEKVMKRFLGLGQPDSGAIRAGLVNVQHHLAYIGYLVERRSWLAAEWLTLADIAAAAHLSVVDYLGDVPWDNFEPAKSWYARIKSRPSFRPLLADMIPGLSPPKHYKNLDF